MAEKEPAVTQSTGTDPSVEAARSFATQVGREWPVDTPRKARRRESGGRWKALLGFLSPVVVLILWEIAVPLGLVDGRFFPPPHAIAGTFWKLTMDGTLFTDVRVSLVRIVLGFLAGAIPGLIIGLSMGLFRPVRWILRPVISATYPIPKLALMPLIILMFGFGETQKVITIALGTFFMVLINTMAGVLNLDKIYLDVAKNYGASRTDFYTRIALPGAMPLIFTGLELGMGMALLLIVAAEMTGAVSGIGYRIWAAQAVFKTKEMFVAFIMISLLGYLFAEGLSSLQRRVIPWKQL
jgi:NitT/TauT family transport system permease protein